MNKMYEKIVTTIVEVLRVICDVMFIIGSREFGNKALMEAVQKGYIQIVKDLIALGANVNQVDIHVTTALLYGAKGGHSDFLKVLIAARAV